MVSGLNGSGKLICFALKINVLIWWRIWIMRREEMTYSALRHRQG